MPKGATGRCGPPPDVLSLKRYRSGEFGAPASPCGPSRPSPNDGASRSGARLTVWIAVRPSGRGSGDPYRCCRIGSFRKPDSNFRPDALSPCWVAFSSREPVSTSLENALAGERLRTAANGSVGPRRVPESASPEALYRRDWRARLAMPSKVWAMISSPIGALTRLSRMARSRRSSALPMRSEVQSRICVSSFALR